MPAFHKETMHLMLTRMADGLSPGFPRYMTDDGLIAAYKQWLNTSEHDRLEAAVLAAEIERRGLGAATQDSRSDMQVARIQQLLSGGDGSTSSSTHNDRSERFRTSTKPGASTMPDLPFEVGNAHLVKVEFTAAELRELNDWIKGLPEPRPDCEQAVRMLLCQRLGISATSASAKADQRV